MGVSRVDGRVHEVVAAAEVALEEDSTDFFNSFGSCRVGVSGQSVYFKTSTEQGSSDVAALLASRTRDKEGLWMGGRHVVE
jgi:hypothetical protein